MEFPLTPLTIDEALHLAERATPLCPTQEIQLVLRKEVLLRWEQRTALSFRLQDLRAALEDAGIAPESKLYGALHDATATAEAWMHPGTLSDAAQTHLARIKRELAESKIDRQQAPATAIEARQEICSSDPAPTVEPDQVWQDEFGRVRVLAVAEGYAMLRRRRSNPFIASVDQMLDGQYGWRRCEP